MPEPDLDMSYSTIEAHQYWMGKLEDCPIEYDLFTDFARSTDYEPQAAHVAIDVGLRQRIVSVSKGNPIAVFVVLLSCFKIMLYKLSGSRDITIVTPAYQDRKAADGFVLLRDILHESMTGKEIINAVKQTVIDGYKYQNYLISKTIRPVRSVYKVGNYQILFAMKDIHQPTNIDELNDMKNDIKVLINNSNDRLAFDVIFNEKVYTKHSIISLMDCFNDIVYQVLQDLHVAIAEIPLMREAGQRKIIEHFNNTEVPLPQSMTLDKLVEEQATKTPQAIAISALGAAGSVEKSLSYRELSEKSNYVANLLRARGGGEGDIIAIIGERTIETVICMLAVLKAGAAFLAIPPSLPEERRAYLLADSDVRQALVTDPSQTSVQPFRTLVVLDAAAIPGTPTLDQVPRTTAAVAYTIYTSGSTGKPKGVLIEHRSIVNTITWRRSWYSFSQNDVVLQIPSFSFDSSIEDIFTTLASGARLLLIEDQYRLDLSYLKQALPHNNVTHFLITPGYYRLLLTHLPDSLRSLRVVTLAGEHFPADLVAQHVAHLPGVELDNEYGPTENSVCSTVYRFSPPDMDVRIGKPIHNVRCYIVNQEGHLMPTGIPGELCVAGVGLARGYLNQPELTSRVFKPSPYLPEDRLYWTGDRAKWLEDGNIVFLGRQDDQVKVRGFRIEPAEIEATIREIEGVTDAAVVVMPNDEQPIYGFFTAGEAIAPHSIKDCLLQRLPYYMVPAQIFQLDYIPLTIHGKVDRRLLRELAPLAPVVGAQGALEERLVELWAECLKLDRSRVSVVADFFDLGGHSLNAVVLVERIQHEFHCQLPLTELLEQSTIRHVAQYLQTLVGAPDGTMKGTVPDW
jgi:amino acid adenylation domain-containing protein